MSNAGRRDRRRLSRPEDPFSWCLTAGEVGASYIGFSRGVSVGKEGVCEGIVNDHGPRHFARDGVGVLRRNIGIPLPRPCGGISESFKLWG